MTDKSVRMAIIGAVLVASVCGYGIGQRAQRESVREVPVIGMRSAPSVRSTCYGTVGQQVYQLQGLGHVVDYESNEDGGYWYVDGIPVEYAQAEDSPVALCKQYGEVINK